MLTSSSGNLSNYRHGDTSDRIVRRGVEQGSHDERSCRSASSRRSFEGCGFGAHDARKSDFAAVPHPAAHEERRASRAGCALRVSQWRYSDRQMSAFPQMLACSPCSFSLSRHKTGVFRLTCMMCITCLVDVVRPARPATNLCPNHHLTTCILRCSQQSSHASWCAQG